jgi:hypothetical protein
MGEKKKCCHKFEKKGKRCSSCPLTTQDDDKAGKKKKASKQAGKAKK